MNNNGRPRLQIRAPGRINNVNNTNTNESLTPEGINPYEDPYNFVSPTLFPNTPTTNQTLVYNSNNNNTNMNNVVESPGPLNMAFNNGTNNNSTITEPPTKRIRYTTNTNNSQNSLSGGKRKVYRKVSSRKASNRKAFGRKASQKQRKQTRRGHHK